MITLKKTTVIVLILTPLVFAGCTYLGNWAKKSADNSAYRLMAEKEREVLGKEWDIDIDPTTTSLTARVLNEAGPAAHPMADESATTEGMTVTLEDTLSLAIANNYDWQSRQEDLYLSALSLSDAEHNFSPIFSETISARASVTPTGTDVERFGSVASNFALTKIVATGARITVGMTDAFSQIFRTANSGSATGEVTASIVQPLLRGFGPLVTLEPLRQSERNLIYQVRTFARYRQSFVISRISSYFRLLQARDTIRNQYAAYQRLILSRQRAELMMQAERQAAFEVDQARQDEIRARNQWISAKTAYVNALNQFKQDLGLPIELAIQPDSKDLDALTSRGLVEVPLTLKDAEQMALDRRLDYQTALEQVEDSERAVKIARQNLLPDLGLRGNYSASDGGNGQPLDLQSNTGAYSGQIDAEIPLDRISERNDYRRSLITLERRKRSAAQLRNSVLLDVRNAWEGLNDSKQSYQIQLTSLDLAGRRVSNVAMLLDAGRSGITIRDQLDAQSALLDAQNAVTRALVDYTINRYNFYNAIEKLEIDERGIWNEDQPKQPGQG